MDTDIGEVIVVKAVQKRTQSTIGIATTRQDVDNIINKHQEYNKELTCEYYTQIRMLNVYDKTVDNAHMNPDTTPYHSTKTLAS